MHKAFKNTNLWLKIIVSPTLLLVLAYFFSQHIKFSIEYYPIVLGLIYALLAQLFEMRYYAPDKLIRLTIIDFFMAFILIYLCGKGLSLLGAASVTFTGALIYGFVQALAEHLHHLWLKPRKKKWRKEKRRKR